MPTLIYKIKIDIETACCFAFSRDLTSPSLHDNDSAGKCPEFCYKSSTPPSNLVINCLSIMDAQQKVRGSRVLVVNSTKSWDYILAQAHAQSCAVVVYFTADWCVPSKYMAGFFRNLALKYRDILFLLVDVDEVKEVKDKMEVKAMPTFLLMKNDVQVDKIVGANADELQKRVANFSQMTRKSAQDHA